MNTQSKIKRLMSMVLCAAMILIACPAVLLTSADELPAKLLISDCETLTGWTKTGGGGALAINANGFTGSAVHNNVSYGAHRTVTYTAPEALDVSGYKTLMWDAMFYTATAGRNMWDEIVATYGNNVHLKIGSSSSDTLDFTLAKMTVTADTTKANWYHFSVNMDDPSSTAGAFDPTALSTFYFATTDGGANTNVVSGFMRIDNLYATDVRSTVPDTPVDDLPEELFITECESLTGWTKTGGMALALSSNGFTGKAVACDISYGAFRTATYTASEALDISGYQTLAWDVMMHTGAQPTFWDAIKNTYDQNVFVKIGSSASDYNVYRLAKMTVEQDSGNHLWYHFSVNMDDPSSKTGSFDPTAMTTFYFTTIDGAVNTSVQNGHIRLDNIRVTDLRNSGDGEMGSSETLVLSEGDDAATNWTYRGSAATPNASNGNPGACVHAEAGYGALREMVFTPATAVDMSGRSTVEWDMCAFLNATPYTESFEAVKASYASTMKLVVSDGTTTATIPVSEWQVGDVQAGGRWRSFAASLADRGLDLTHIVSFQWVALPTGTGTLDTSLATMFYRFDNVKATANTVMYITALEVASQPAKTEYELGETLDTTGLTLTATYSDDSSETVTEGFAVSGFDSETAGDKTVTVTYGGLSATFTVAVNEPAVLGEIIDGVYYEDGEPVHKGLIKIDGDYYYIASRGIMAADMVKWVGEAWTNGLLPAGLYVFDETGKMIDKNGIINGIYYENDVPVHKGMIELGGDLYYIASGGVVATGSKWVGPAWTNGLVPAGVYEFGADGKIVVKNGIVNGRYYVNGVETHAGLIEIDGDYYYIASGGVVATGTKWVGPAWTNGLVPAGTYTFDETGRMVRDV